MILNFYSFIHLCDKYRGVHVRPGFQEQYETNPDRYKGRNLMFFDTIEQAFTYSEELENSLIFIHSGHYKPEYLIIDSSVALIGSGIEFVVSLQLY